MKPEDAARQLAQGGIVAIPTETVYGLAADAQNSHAVQQIYQLKNRPIGHPLIIHIAPDGDPNYWASAFPAEAIALAEEFWPGPLTMILPKRDTVLDMVSGGQDTVGIRCPAHPVAQRVLTCFSALKASGQGALAAPSANRFGQVSPTLAVHVQREFAAEIAHGKLSLLESGPAEVGIESTIVDLSGLQSGKAVRLLRPGQISREQLAQVLGYMPEFAAPHEAPKASGTLKAHYAPQTPIFWLPETGSLPLSKQQLLDAAQPPAKGVILAFTPPACVPEHFELHRLDADPAAVAESLYRTLRDIDDAGYQIIYVQRPPAGLQWEGVLDRLSRAVASYE